MASGQHLLPADRRERGRVRPEAEEWRYPGRIGRDVVVVRHASGIGGSFLLVAIEGNEAERFGLRLEDFVRRG